MKIVFAASEAVPYCKTGGLADVAGALSKELSLVKNNKVILFLPLYKDIDRNKFKLTKVFESSVVFGGSRQSYSLYQHQKTPRYATYFVYAPRYFNRKGLYGYSGGDHHDNLYRFGFFSKALLDAITQLKFNPDIIHSHDWQTGLVPILMKDAAESHSLSHHPAAVFSIHNMAYQGLFKEADFKKVRPSPIPSDLKFRGEVSLLKGGINFSDFLNTVSPTYAKEIAANSRFGRGLEGVLKRRRKKFRGVLNGLDVKYWDPSKDGLIKHTYSKTNLSARSQNKLYLQKKLKFPVDANVPLLGFVGRLDNQKGVETILSLAAGLIEKGVQMVFLGQGDPKLQQKILNLEKLFPRQVKLENKFAEEFAHQIYASVDLFLMPSIFEPCGLGQLIAMRYGAIPVVTPTGGLKDTVIDFAKGGAGFVARTMKPLSYSNAVERALLFLKNPSDVRKLQKKMMGADFSWRRSTRDYLRIYEAIRKKRHG